MAASPWLFMDDLDEPAPAPGPMDDAQARRLARKMFDGRGATRRRGRACVVGVRPKKSSKTMFDLGMGDTWERAFHAALQNDGK